MKEENTSNKNHPGGMLAGISSHLSFPKSVIGNLNLVNHKAVGVPDTNLRVRQDNNTTQTPDKSFPGWNKAFTLIELLVVVLIIGILAAIALPQYQVAVGKAKYTQLMVNGNALATATQSYRLATNQWPTDWDSLDISLPVNQECSKWVNHANTSSEIFVIYCANGTNRYRVHMAVNGTKSQMCECDENSILGNRICKSVTGKQMPDSNYNGVNLYNF